MSKKRTYPSSPTIDLYAQSPGTDGSRLIPEPVLTPVERFMQAIPLVDSGEPEDGPSEAVEEAVRQAMDVLDHKELVVIQELILSPNHPDASLRKVGKMLGIDKNAVARLRDNAFMKLQEALMDDTAIIKKVGTWQDAAHHALDLIIENESFGLTFKKLQTYVTAVENEVDLAWHHHKNWETAAVIKDLQRAGYIAYLWLSRYQSHMWTPNMQVNLLVDRQTKYGHSNILKFEELGLVVRMSDKAARLSNMEEDGRDFEDESVMDTWMDVLGYATIATMLDEGTFTLELS